MFVARRLQSVFRSYRSLSLSCLLLVVVVVVLLLLSNPAALLYYNFFFYYYYKSFTNLSGPASHSASRPAIQPAMAARMYIVIV